jgi:hypothetical protein
MSATAFVVTTSLRQATSCRLSSEMKQEALQKVTVRLPRDLVKRATRASGQGLSATIRQGLEAVTRAEAFRYLRRLRGKVKFSIDVDQLRED